MNGAISFHKDVILMSEKRFKPSDPNVPIPNYLAIIWDSEKCKHMSQDDVVVCLNEQQEKIIELQEIIIDLKDDKNQLHKVISKLRQEVAELKTRNAVLSSKLNQIPKSIREVWLDE